MQTDSHRPRKLPLRHLFVALLLAFGAVTAFAKDHADKSAKRVDHIVKKMEKELKLSADQSAKIRDILKKDSGFAWHGGHRGMRPEGHAGFSAQMRADVVDTAALARGFEERLALQRERHARHVAAFTAIHAVLTPAQRAKAAGHMDERFAKMEKR